MGDQGDAAQVSASLLLHLLDAVGAGEPLSSQEVRSLVAGDDVPDRVGAEIVERVVYTAGRVARWRRREAELSALISSARELVEVRDVQQLLQRLVDRAHDLTATDLTYLSEYDEKTDELWVRATRGAVSADLPQLRVPAGVGLASAVVHSRTAQWTADYDSEERFPHNTEIDEAIKTEAMRSVLGVPMIAGGQVLGVLFAADRSAHSFGAEEIALLSAFADHAAVILQTANLFAAARTSAVEAEAAHAQARHHAGAMERAASVHEDLTRLVLAGRGAAEVADLLARSLRRPVAVLDRDLRRMASTDEAVDASWDADGQPRPEVRDALEESRHSGHCATVDGADRPAGGVVVAAVTGTLLLGGLVVGPGSPALTEVERRTAERAGQIVALLTMQQDAVAQAEEHVRGELVADLVHRRISLAEIDRRGRAQGIQLDHPWSVVALLTPHDRRQVRKALSTRAPDWLVGEYDSGTVVLVPDDAPADAARTVHQRLTTAGVTPCVAVAAPRAVPPDEIATVVDEAWTCANLLPALGVRDAAVVTNAYAPYLAMFGSGAEHAAEFVDRTIGQVAAWDAAHGTDLMTTLASFLANNASPVSTARELYVHVNTVKQRLERITALLGADWRTPESLFRISVAVRLHALRKSAN